MNGPEMSFEEAKIQLLQRFHPETAEDSAALIKAMEAIDLQIRRKPSVSGKHGEFFRCGQHIETLREDDDGIL